MSRAVSSALQTQIGDKIAQLRATRRKLEAKLEVLQRREAELKQAQAQLERPNAEPDLEAQADEHALPDSANQPGDELQGVHLLVVDDSHTNRELAQHLLESAGARITTAVDGEDAIRQLSAQHHPFDAVLMDIEMPVMDGPDAARHIRRVLGFITLPIFALSAEASQSERQRALDSGMNAFLTKPLDPKALLRALQGDLEPNHERAVLSHEYMPMPKSWPNIAGLDRRLSYRSCSGDRDLLLRVLGQLCAELEELRAVDDTTRNDTRLAARLHKLQGSASTMGASRVGAAAAQALAATKLGHEQALFALRHSLIPEIETLQRALLPLITAARNELDSRQACAPKETADQLLHTLIERLEEQRTDAIETFVDMRPSLSARLPADHLLALQRAIEALEYEGALELLTQYRSSQTLPKRF